MTDMPVNEKSFWREFYPGEPVYPGLTDTVSVDVAIVGAGIAGLTSAYLLKQAGFTVAVVEKHTVGGGTTGRTTGKVTSQHGLTYADLQKRFGDKTAALYGEANQAGIEEIERIIREEKIACDWQRDDNYVYTTDPAQVKHFQNEAAVAARLGLPATFETDTPLPFSVQGAVKFADQAKINTQKYLLGLSAAVHGGGSYVFEQSTATGIREGIAEGKPGHVRTRHGQVNAAHIIIASSIPTLPLMARVGYAIHEYPSESYLVAGPLTRELRGMYISPDKHNYSILPFEADEGQKVLLIGGEGHLWGLRGNRHARYERLAGYADEHFAVSKITNRWSDRDYIGYDRVPLVGMLYPWSKRLYVATAFRKWGLANGMAAAMMLRDHITGRDNPWAAVYNPRRPSIRNRLRG